MQYQFKVAFCFSVCQYCFFNNIFRDDCNISLFYLVKFKTARCWFLKMLVVILFNLSQLSSMSWEGWMLLISSVMLLAVDVKFIVLVFSRVYAFFYIKWNVCIRWIFHSVCDLFIFFCVGKYFLLVIMPNIWLISVLGLSVLFLSYQYVSFTGRLGKNGSIIFYFYTFTYSFIYE